MSYEEIIYAVEDGNIAIITLNRPEAMNALTHQTHDELGQAISEANLTTTSGLSLSRERAGDFVPVMTLRLFFWVGEKAEEPLETTPRSGIEKHSSDTFRARK